MTNTLFLQSGIADPYAIYNEQLKERPVFWDAANQLWAVYDYASCRALLSDPLARIPAVSLDGLNDYALAISGRLVRLSNMPGHLAARQAAMLLMQQLREPVVAATMQALIKGASGETDWVEQVAKRLMVLSMLRCFEIEGEAADFMATHIGALVKIMQPVKTVGTLAAINAIAKDSYCLLEKQVQQKDFLQMVVNKLVSDCAVPVEEALALVISNIAGLLIQSYDAGRGLLSNALLQFVRGTNISAAGLTDSRYLQQCVVETLRFDPPVHNTRRVARERIDLGNGVMEKGQLMLIVMAAANRDSRHFADPHCYDIARPNNAEHLTFGFGAHACVANRLSIRITTEALLYLFRHYNNVRLIEPAIEYEPMINARLPKRILISLQPAVA